MDLEQEIQSILDRNFTRGDNAKALKELLDLYNVVGQKEQLPEWQIYQKAQELDEKEFEQWMFDNTPQNIKE